MTRYKQWLEERIVSLGKFIVRNHATVRQAAKVYGISKSTVHKDMTEKLPQIDQQLAAQVAMVIQRNKEDRHIRGGEATRKRWSRIHV